MNLVALVSGLLACILPGAQPVLESSTSAGVTVRLAPDAVAADAAVVGTQLTKRANNKGDTLEGLDLRLLAANWMLAYELEPIATRTLLGIPADDDPSRAAAVVSRAEEQLVLGARLLDSLDSETLVEEKRAVRRTQIEKLEAFAGAFAAIWPDKEPAPDEKDATLREAAFALADVLEDERLQVAFSAQFWQAYLYGLRGRTNRAKDLLPPVIDQPQPAQGPFGLYARILHSRFMTNADNVEEGADFVAPLALLARLESRCTASFENVTLHDPARRTVALVQRQIAANWAKSLHASSANERAAWCDNLVRRIDEEHFSSDSPATVLRLMQAAPAIVDLSNAEGIALKGHKVALDDEDMSPAPLDAGTTGVE